MTGKTVGENIAGCVNKNPEVIRPIENPYSQTGGIAVLKGNLAPETAVVKRSAVAPEMMVHEGPARVFDCEDDAIDAIKNGKIVPGDVVVIRYEGPKGGPGMREMLNPTSAIAGMGMGSSVALITDGRFSGAFPRSVYRPCMPGSRCGRTDCSGGGRGYYQHQYPGKPSGCEGIRGRDGKQTCKMAAQAASGYDRISGQIPEDGYQCQSRSHSGN